MSEPSIRKARYVKHPTDIILGTTHYRQAIETTSRGDPGGAEATGPLATGNTRKRLWVDVYFRDLIGALTVMEAVVANLVVGYQDGAGTNRKRTYKGVKFVSFVSSMDVPRADSPGNKPPVIGIRGIGTTATGTDDVAQMILDAVEMA